MSVHIHCPSYRELVAAMDIDLRSKIGKCIHCNSLFTLKHDLERLELKSNLPVLRPREIDILYHQNKLELSLPQPLLVYDIIVLCIFPITCILAMIIYVQYDFVISAYIGIFSFLVSMYSFVRAINKKKNRIYIQIDETDIKIQWRPNHMVMDKSYRVSEVSQVYIQVTKKGLSLFVILTGHGGNRHIPMINKILKLKYAKYLEQEIENHLKLPNRKVVGEV